MLFFCDFLYFFLTRKSLYFFTSLSTFQSSNYLSVIVTPYTVRSCSLEMLNSCSSQGFLLKKECYRCISNVFFLTLFWEGEVLWRQVNYSSYIKAWLYKKYQMLLKLSSIPVNLMTFTDIYESIKLPSHIYSESWFCTPEVVRFEVFWSLFDISLLQQKQTSRWAF